MYLAFNSQRILEFLKGYLPDVQAFLLNFLIAIVLLIAGKFLIKWSLKLIDKIMKKTNTEITVRKFLVSLVKVILYVVLLIIICDCVGIQTTSFIAILSTAGLAIGLALQGSLSNFAGGVLILILKPFKVNDYIYDGGSGREGTVKKIDLFYTSLSTPDNKFIVIPNGVLANSSITNMSTYPKRRIDINIGISYSDDIDKAKKVISEIVSKEDRVLKDEDNQIIVKGLAASEVTLEARIWVNNENYWDVNFALTEQFKKAFDENGIEIPFNQLQVHIAENKEK